MSNKADKLTDLLKDLNIRLKDGKSDTELILEYFAQI